MDEITVAIRKRVVLSYAEWLEYNQNRHAISEPDSAAPIQVHLIYHGLGQLQPNIWSDLIQDNKLKMYST